MDRSGTFQASNYIVTTSKKLIPCCSFGSSSHGSETPWADALQVLFKPFVKPITAETFVDPVDGEIYYTPSAEPIWTKGLGKDLCIIDVDTRSLNNEQDWMNEKFNWNKLEGVSVGMINHYMYGGLLHSVVIWRNN